MSQSKAAKLIHRFNEADFDPEDMSLLHSRVAKEKKIHAGNNWMQDQLELIVTNDGEIYRTMIAPLIQKMKNPTYSKDRAEVEWGHIVKDSVDKHNRENNITKNPFPVSIQIKTAHDLMEKYYRRIANGDFD